MAIQCTVVAQKAKVDSFATAMAICDEMPSCEGFAFTASDRFAQFCRGIDTRTLAKTSGTAIGIKSSWFAQGEMAVFTNMRILCPSTRLLAEMQDKMALDDATSKCTSLPSCSHFSIDFAGARSTPSNNQASVFCSGNPAIVPEEGAVAFVRAEPRSS